MEKIATFIGCLIAAVFGLFALIWHVAWIVVAVCLPFVLLGMIFG